MNRFLSAVVGILLLGYVQVAIGGQNASDQSVQDNPAKVAAEIQRQLELRYPLSRTTADGGDVVAIGASLVLQKDNLVLNKVYMSEGHPGPLCHNLYSNGVITQTGLMGALSKINAFLGILGNAQAPSRSFDHGQELFVTKITWWYNKAAMWRRLGGFGQHRIAATRRHRTRSASCMRRREACRKITPKRTNCISGRRWHLDRDLAAPEGQSRGFRQAQ
jgi:hypothetical protein